MRRELVTKQITEEVVYLSIVSEVTAQCVCGTTHIVDATDVSKVITVTCKCGCVLEIDWKPDYIEKPERRRYRSDEQLKSLCLKIGDELTEVAA